MTVKRFWLGLVFLAAFAGFVIAEAPLSIALELARAEARGLSYRSAEGTVWNGVVRGASLGGQDLGDVELRLAPSALLAGAARLHVGVRGPAIAARGAIEVDAGGRLTARDLIIDADVTRLNRLHPVVREREGRLSATVRRLTVDRTGCLAADGEVYTDVLTHTPERDGWTGPDLQGDVTCQGGEIMFQLAGADGSAAIAAEAGVQVSGRTRVEVQVDTTDPQLVLVLPLLGFETREQGFRYVRDTMATAPAQS